MFASGWIEPGVDSRAIRHRLKSDACDWTKCYKWNMGTVRISGPRSRRARRARQRIDNEGEWASWGGLIHRRHRRNIHLHNSFLSVRFPQAGILNHRRQRFPFLSQRSKTELLRLFTTIEWEIKQETLSSPAFTDGIEDSTVESIFAW